MTRLFQFFCTFPGDYTINVFPIGFAPYIYILDSGYVPPPGYVVGGQLTITIGYSPPPAGISGFVGDASFDPDSDGGVFGIRVICPDTPPSANILFDPAAPAHVRASCAALFGLGGVVTYVPNTVHYDGFSGAHPLQLEWVSAGNQWVLHFDGSPISITTGATATFPPVDPSGYYFLNLPFGSWGFIVSI